MSYGDRALYNDPIAVMRLLNTVATRIMKRGSAIGLYGVWARKTPRVINDIMRYHILESQPSRLSPCSHSS